MDKNNRSSVQDEIGVGASATTNGKVAPSNTRRLALAALLVSLYVAANSVPIDAFIGGAGFITVGIILLPVVAGLLKPRDALIAAVLASIGLLALQLSIIPVFGFYGLLVPTLGMTLGSLGIHKSLVYPAAYIVFGTLWYALFSGGTILWLVPYALTIGLVAIKQTRLVKLGKKGDLMIYCLSTTMCELVTMNIGSISLLHLPGQVWLIITPFMFAERAVAVVGSSSILLGLLRIKGPLKLEGI